jgi:hypothetical protein
MWLDATCVDRYRREERNPESSYSLLGTNLYGH